MPRRFLFCLLLTCSLTLPAQETRQTLHISAGEWPPYLSSQLPQQGVMAHLLRDVLADEGYQVEFRFLPWPRAYAAAAAGRFAATAVWMHKSEREQDFLYSAPVLDEQFVFFHLRQMRFDWQTFSDLRGLTLGGSLEYSYGPAFDAFLERGEVPMERVSSDQQNFEKLLKGRIQLYPQERNVGLAALRNLPGAAAQITHAPCWSTRATCCFRKACPAVSCCGSVSTSVCSNTATAGVINAISMTWTKANTVRPRPH